MPLSLKDFIEENLNEFISIRDDNDFGYCDEAMEEIIDFLKPMFNTRRLVIYGGDDYGFIEQEFVYRNPMPDISIIENGRVANKEYVIHWLPIIDDRYVIDVHYSDKIDSVEDILFYKRDYLQELKKLNECQINTHVAS